MVWKKYVTVTLCISWHSQPSGSRSSGLWELWHRNRANPFHSQFKEQCLMHSWMTVTIMYQC